MPRAAPRSTGPVLRRRKSVALIVETSNSYGRGLLRGIGRYSREQGSWSLFLPEQRRGESPPEWLRTWKGDGIIARIENPEVAACVGAAGLPAVDVSAARLLPQLPWVETDDDAIARLAFAHLQERGFRSLGFVGDTAFAWSNGRRDRFVASVDAARLDCHVLDAGAADRAGPWDWDSRQELFVTWIRGLPRPTGVFCCYDTLAQALLDACRRIDVAVPEEITVLGVDNDEILCELSTPPLSSVILDTERTGYEAAALLDRLMRCEGVETTGHLVPPLGIATRQSTDVLAVADPHVAEALRFIREHACDGIDVGDVLGRSKLSRRALESRFLKLMGRTPHSELLRVRLAAVKTLLLQTDLSVAEIAERTGYAHIEYLSAQFARVVGEPPTHFRTRHGPYRG
jgi:LacI family transcriptional regulator